MHRILLCLALLVSCFAAQAQEAWPARPVKLIVPSSAGGGTDVYARILAQALGESLKQQFIVDNRPGASGNIGAAAAAKSAADGYTFLVSANPALAVNPRLYKELPYNAGPDFTPGTGSPTFLGVRMLEEGTGARFTHVPYKGVGAAYADLLGGQVQFLFPDVASAISHLKAGKLRTLAITQATEVLPGTPTFAEAGLPLEVITSFSVVAPAGTPTPIVQRIAGEIGRAMRSTPVAEKLEAQVLVPVFDTPEQFAASLKKERDGWADFIRRNGIQPDH